MGLCVLCKCERSCDLVGRAGIFVCATSVGKRVCRSRTAGLRAKRSVRHQTRIRWQTAYEAETASEETFLTETCIDGILLSLSRSFVCSAKQRSAVGCRWYALLRAHYFCSNSWRVCNVAPTPSPAHPAEYMPVLCFVLMLANPVRFLSNLQFVLVRAAATAAPSVASLFKIRRTVAHYVSLCARQTMYADALGVKGFVDALVAVKYLLQLRPPPPPPPQAAATGARVQLPVRQPPPVVRAGRRVRVLCAWVC